MMVGEFVEQSFIGGSWKTDDMKMKNQHVATITTSAIVNLQTNNI